MKRSFVIIGAAVLTVFLLALLTFYFLILASNTTGFQDSRNVQIPRGASFEDALDELQRQDIVARRRSLSLLGRLTGWGDQVKAGNYAFESGASNYDILQTLRRGLQTPVRVVIPPGSRKDVIAAVVAREMAFEKQDFLAALGDSSLAAELGTDTLHMFSYLLPETYFFYWLTSPEDVIWKVKKSFDSFYESNAEGGNPQSLTMDEVLRVASLVEWESDLLHERPTIAGVYLNRLRDGWLLQADPTVQFALIEIEGQKRRLFFRDYKIDHPFNTYIIRGLPPGPVTNPAPTAVAAALHPEEHNYYYFVATGDGGHLFSRTLREHNSAAAAYYRRLRERAASN